VVFDSGDLGTGPPGRTAAAQRLTWRVPRNLPRGTYTYFCRIHPFMRGAFRVVGRA
jgi:plastocyanin